jgi:hypothetical protein
MKGICAVLLSGLLGITAFSQKNSNNDHTLLWKISGNGLKKAVIFVWHHTYAL